MCKFTFFSFKKCILSVLGHGDFIADDQIVMVLKAIGKPAKEFLLHVVKGRPLNEDNEKAANLVRSRFVFLELRARYSNQAVICEGVSSCQFDAALAVKCFYHAGVFSLFFAG